MKKIAIIISFMFVTASIFSNISFAGGLIFEPIDTCEPLDKEMQYYSNEEIMFWASGYIAGKTGLAESIHELGWIKLEGELSRLCEQSPNLSYVALVEKYIQIRNYEFGSAEQGQKMLDDFVASGASLASFIGGLKPTEEDILAVYKQPLADNLINAYEKMYASLDGLKMKPEHNDVLSIFSTTAKMANNNTDLKYFPGGYANLTNYFLGDYPIGFFKFVKQGETRGFSFDGLIFVNDRWVLMPKPWRGLK